MRLLTSPLWVRRALAGVWAVTRATVAQAWADRVLGLAAEVGFWALLSLTPLLLVLVAAAGYLGSLFGVHLAGEVDGKILSVAGHVLAQAAVHNVLRPVLAGVLHDGEDGIASVSLVVALWTGSTAMSTYVNTIAIAYGMRDVRSAVRARVIAFVIYLGGLVVAIVALALLVSAPRWLTATVPRSILPAFRPLAAYVYWPAIIMVSTGLLATLYHVAAPRRGRWRRDLPGAVVAMALWLVSSLLLRAYLSFAIGHSPTYGALSAPVAALLFLYLTALAVLLGAELNAQVAGLRPAARDPVR